jgi:hypothetical protein
MELLKLPFIVKQVIKVFLSFFSSYIAKYPFHSYFREKSSNAPKKKKRIFVLKPSISLPISWRTIKQNIKRDKNKSKKFSVFNFFSFFFVFIVFHILF